MREQDINARVTMEATLLKALSKKEYYDHYWGYVNHHILAVETTTIGKDYKKYYEIYPDHKDIQWDLFSNQFSTSWHNRDLSDSDINHYCDYVIPEIVKSNGEDVESVLLGVMGKELLEKIDICTEQGVDIAKIRSLVDEYENKYNNIVKLEDKDCFHLDEIDYSILELQNGIPYFLPTLQRSLGGLMPGNFVVVSADVNTGKSAFIISQVVSAFKYLHEVGENSPILYFNSEDTLAEVGMRFFSNLHHNEVVEGYEQLVKTAEKTTNKFKNKYNTKLFKGFQLFGQNIAYIRNKVKKYRPSLVVIDITDKLSADEDPKNLKKLFDGLRDMAAEFLVPIIGTTQAGDQKFFNAKENKMDSKKYLSSSNAYGSKTGKGGSATVFIGIGKDIEESSTTRYINIGKKKRGSFARITCEIVEEYSLYREVF